MPHARLIRLGERSRQGGTPEHHLG